MATHSSILPWRIPWTEGTRKSVARVGHDLAIKPPPLVSDKNRDKERSESGPTIHSVSPAQHLGVITGLTHISVPHLCLKYTCQQNFQNLPIFLQLQHYLSVWKKDTHILPFLVVQAVRNLPAMQETWIQSLVQADNLEKGTLGCLFQYPLPLKKPMYR